MATKEIPVTLTKLENNRDDLTSKAALKQVNIEFIYINGNGISSYIKLSQILVSILASLSVTSSGIGLGYPG